MKKRMIAAGVAVAFSLAGIGAAAYTNYCDSAAATSLTAEYAPRIKNISTQFDMLLSSLHDDGRAGQAAPVLQNDIGAAPSSTAEHTGAQSGAEPSDGAQTAPQTSQSSDAAADNVPQEAPPQEQLAALYMERLALFDEFSAEIDALEYELAPMLIDYDMLLKKLKLLYDEYKGCKAYSEECASSFRLGICTLSEVEAAKKDTESKYYEIEAILHEVSALKTDIEAVTGTTLTSDFDFSSAYIITDAIKLVPAELTGIYGGASICMPDGSELSEIEIADISGQYNAAVKCYYALGSAMRDYISAADALKKGEADFRLGLVTEDTINALTAEKTAVYMAASQAKADYAKALLELDMASSGALTKGLFLSAGRASAYKSAVSNAQSGSGLWVMSRTATGNVYTVAALPKGMYVEEDDIVSWSMTYDGKAISKSGTGGACKVRKYIDGCDHAEITFYINNVRAGTYKVDVFAPFGEFIG